METPFFEHLSYDERVDCLVFGQMRKCPAGSVLIQRGAKLDGLQILLSGQATVAIGKAQLAVIEAGAVLGEISFVLGSAASADVTASTDVSVLELSRHALDALLLHHPSVTASLYRSLAAELARRLVKLSDRYAG